MKHDFPELKTPSLLLRQIQEADLENIYHGLSDTQVTQYYAVHYSTLEKAQEQMKWYRDLEQNHTGIWWAVCDMSQTFLGAAGFNGLNRIHQKAEIGFWLLPKFWGKGILTELMPALEDYGFNQLGLHRIEALVEHDNENSRKALLKRNFQLEGTMVDCEIKDGRFISLDMFAKISR